LVLCPLSLTCVLKKQNKKAKPKTSPSISPMARFNKFQANTHTFHILILEECCMSSVLCKKHLFTKQKNPIFHRNNYMKAVVCRLIMFMRLKSSVSDIENSLSVPHSIKKGA